MSRGFITFNTCTEIVRAYIQSRWGGSGALLPQIRDLVLPILITTCIQGPSSVAGQLPLLVIFQLDRFLAGSGILWVSGMVCVCLRGMQHKQ